MPQVKGLKDPLGDWAREEPSVFDSPLERAARRVARLFGLDDPNSQIQSLMNPMAAPLAAVEKKVAGPLAQKLITGVKGAAAKLWPQTHARPAQQFAPVASRLFASLTPAERKAALEAEKALKGITLRGRPAADLAETIGVHIPGDPADIVGNPASYRLRDATADRVEHLAEIGSDLPLKSDWSGSNLVNPDPELLAAFGGDPDMMHRFARFTAANTPRTGWSASVREATALHDLLLQRPRLANTAGLTSAHGKKLGLNLFDTKIPNANRALRGEAMSGPKVAPMDRYLLEKPGPGLPMDTHAIHGVGVEKSEPSISAELPRLKALFNRAEGTAGTARVTKLNPTGITITDDMAVDRYTEALSRTLQDIHPDLTPEDIFGRYFWRGAQAHKGITWEGGLKDVLRPLGLLKAGAMMNQKALAKALARNNWSPTAIVTFLALLGAEREDEEQAEREPVGPVRGTPPPRPPSLFPSITSPAAGGIH